MSQDQAWLGRRHYEQRSAVTNVYVLIDYDNAKATRARETTEAQARASLQRLLDSTERLFRVTDLAPNRTYFELYGGWRNPDGYPSEENQRLLRVLGDFVGTKAGTSRTAFTLVQSIVGCADTLVGTRDSGNQKMVDGMLVLDVVSRARELSGTDSAIVVVSADVDILPGLILAAEVSNRTLPLFLLRLLLIHDTRPDTTPQDRHLADRAAVISFRR